MSLFNKFKIGLGKSSSGLTDGFKNIFSKKNIDEEQLKMEKKKLTEEADEKASVWHTTSEVWDDGVIDPIDTRKYLSLALAAVYNNEIKGSNSFGVFRM